MDIQEVISELNRIQAAGLISAYAIGGAVAAQAYLEPAATMDVDVFVVFAADADTSVAPLTDIWADLVAHGAKVENLYLVIGGWPVQLLPSASPLLRDAILNARPKPFGSQLGMILGPEHLAAIAIETGRNKDLARVEEFITRRQVDMQTLTSLVQRFGLTTQWQKFAKRYLGSDA